MTQTQTSSGDGNKTIIVIVCGSDDDSIRAIAEKIKSLSKEDKNSLYKYLKVKI